MNTDNCILISLKFGAVPSIGVNKDDSDTESLADSAEPNSTDSQKSPKSRVILTGFFLLFVIVYLI